MNKERNKNIKSSRCFELDLVLTQSAVCNASIHI